MNFTNLTRSYLPVGIMSAVATVFICSCAHPADDVSEMVVGTQSSLEITGPWIGDAIGVAPPTLTLIGKVATGGRAQPKSKAPTPGKQQLPPGVKDDVLGVSNKKGQQFALNYSPEQLRAIGAEAEKRGLDQASEPQEAAIEKGFSGGVDNRTRWTGTTSPRSYIGAWLKRVLTSVTAPAHWSVIGSCSLRRTA